MKANDSGEDRDLLSQQDVELQEGIDFFLKNGLFVFTAECLLQRGYCCESGSRHCPYADKNL